ncbi:putative Regulatory protein, LysR [Cupriavidus taiwanensis]|uniref:LysR family transcriptional regulator n=1 Tax=Cupriavidus taiwanensis TaxID=164546 RepID=UPI000E146DD6|nr:LysR family transcriptional regulator [Cupriavidus taiwanensis]SPA16020.1 putative Regulatory protein, LysR [Cupriavidus taiwanensis]
MRHADVYTLRVFLLAFELRHTRLVANALGISRARVRYALGKLDQVVGGPLFERTEVGLSPTRLAFKVFPVATRMVEMWREVISSSIPAGDRPGQGTLRIKFSASLGERVITAIMSRLITSLPHHSIKGKLLDPGTGASIALTQNRCDCAIVVDPQSQAQIHAVELLRVPRRVASAVDVARPGHWILINDDATPGSAVRKAVEREASGNFTVVATLSAQLAVWRNLGGTTSLLEFCMPADVENVENGVLPTGFPRVASIGLCTLQGRQMEPWLSVVQHAAMSVMTDVNIVPTTREPRVACA